MKIKTNLKFYYLIYNEKEVKFKLLGIGDWGLVIGPNPQSPIPNPQSPIPNPQLFFYILKFIFFKKIFLNFIFLI